MAEPERRGVKREFAEMPLAYDPEEIMRHMKALVCDQPKILVDLGGIPDQLGIEECISIRVPSLTLKVPRHLQDPTPYYKALRTVLTKSLEQDNYKNLIELNYQKMFGTSSFNQELVATRHYLEAIGNNLEEISAANLGHFRMVLDDSHRYDLHSFVICMSAFMRHQPEILALLAGIPDMLQIKDCLSYQIPTPTVKVPGRVLHNPTEYYEALHGILEKSLAETDLESKVDQKAASGISMAPIHDLLQVIDNQLGEEPEPANLDASLASLHLNPRMKQPARNGTVGCKYTKYNYDDRRNNAPTVILKRKCGVDTLEVIYSKGILVNEPGVVFAIGGIPEELKIKGAKSFSFPCPIFKFPRTLPADPILREKIMSIAYNGAVERFGSRKLFLQAYKEAMGVSLIPEPEPPEEEEKVRFYTHNMHGVPCTTIEVNLAGPLKKIPHQLWWMFIDGADSKSYRHEICIGSLLQQPINGAGQESSGGSLIMEPIFGRWTRRTKTCVLADNINWKSILV